MLLLQVGGSIHEPDPLQVPPFAQGVFAGALFTPQAPLIQVREEHWVSVPGQSVALRHAPPQPSSTCPLQLSSMPLQISGVGWTLPTQVAIPPTQTVTPCAHAPSIPVLQGVPSVHV